MSSASTLEAQIAALVQHLEEAKEAERRENERKEAEAAAKRACLDEEHRMWEEGEAQAAREQHDAEEHHVEQERQEEVRWCELHQETSLLLSQSCLGVKARSQRWHRSCRDATLA